MLLSVSIFLFNNKLTPKISPIITIMPPRRFPIDMEPTFSVIALIPIESSGKVVIIPNIIPTAKSLIFNVEVINFIFFTTWSAKKPKIAKRNIRKKNSFKKFIKN